MRVNRASVENVVLNVWQKGLYGSRPAVDANYFSIGGQSVQLIKIFSTLNEEFGVQIPVDMFFARPTPGAMIDYILAEKGTEQPQSDNHTSTAANAAKDDSSTAEAR